MVALKSFSFFAVLQGHYEMYRYGFMYSFCSGHGVLVHSDNSCFSFVLENSQTLSLFSVSFWTSFWMYERSHFSFISFISVSLCSTFWAVSLVLPLGSLIFTNLLSINCPLNFQNGGLTYVQWSNTSFTRDYTCVTITQSKVKNIACSPESRLSGKTLPKLNTLLTSIVID